jgi:hypothetical protein
MTESIMVIVDCDEIAVLCACAFCHNDYRVTRSLIYAPAESWSTESRSEQIENLLVTERVFRYQDKMGLPGDPGP